MFISIVRLIVFIAGLAIVAGTFLSAVRTFVLPRSAPDQLTRAIFLLVRRLFNLVLKRTASYEDRDRVMALCAITTPHIQPLAARLRAGRRE